MKTSIVVALLLVGSTAHAEEEAFGTAMDPERSGTYLLFTSEEKRAALKLRDTDEKNAWGFAFSISGPLDKETRTAALVANDLAKGLRASLLIEYSTLDAAWKKFAGTRNAKPPKGPFYTYRFGLESVELDHRDVFEADAATDSDGILFYDLKVGGEAVIDTSRVRATARTGVGFTRQPAVSEVERCTSVPSTDPDVSAMECKNVLFAPAIERDIEPSLSASVQILVSLPRDATSSKPAPRYYGLVGTFRYEDKANNKADQVVTVGAAAFVSPTKGKVNSRFGLGVEHAFRRGAGQEDATSVYIVFGAFKG